jgi:AcrR family transcriptional regulator
MSKRFSDEQITQALRQAEAGTPIAEVCRELGVSKASFYLWRKTYGKLGRTGIRRSNALSRQLSREDWITEARKALVKSGIDDVKVDQLAKTMRVTRGSFYWHFEGRQALLDALLQDWEVRNHGELAQVRDRWSVSDPDLSEIVAIWLAEEPGFPAFDMAVRIWARKSPSVARAVRRIDSAWITLLTDLFRHSGFNETHSLVRARIAYFHQIGYYALAHPDSLKDRLQLAPDYYRSLTGREPGAKLARVLSQFGRAAPSNGKNTPAARGGKSVPTRRRHR